MITDGRLAKARALVAHLEAGEPELADAIIRDLSALHETALFQELGRITRELHEAINGVLLDARLQQIVNQEIPDAAERLKYVITMTEQAANTTLNAVEASVPLVEALREQATRLAGDWQRFRARQLQVEDFRRLAGDLDQFLARTDRKSVV
jgi:chemotaxis protein CheZ